MSEANVLRLLYKCKFLTELEKENEASTAGPVQAAAVGYVNPPAGISTPNFRNVLYSKNGKKKKEKYLMKTE